MGTSMKPFTGKADDKCPKWAQDMIQEILLLEIQLGNIPPAGDWTEKMLEDLEKRVHADVEATEQASQRFFKQVCLGLSKEGFSSKDISLSINSRVGYIGGPPYCNVAEVDEALAPGLQK